jgi:hypothetical protein
MNKVMVLILFSVSLWFHMLFGAKAMVKPPPSKPKRASIKAKPAPLHPPAQPVEITPSVIKKVADLLHAAGFDRAFTVLEATTNVYVVHLEGEYNNRVITLQGDKPVIN